MQIKKYINYQNDSSLVASIKELIKPSYKNAGSHVTHDIELCNELYTVESQIDEILAFFMVGYHSINLTDYCYLGLSTCRQEYKNSGYVKALYLEFARDCIRKELDRNRRIICYWTTATPIVYHWFNKYFQNVQPDRQGNISEEGREILLTIANKQYSAAGFDQNIPFLLRHAAKGINYSDEEQLRIKKAITDLQLNVFDTYSLDETKGDRFLMFGNAPSHDRLINFTQRLNY